MKRVLLLITLAFFFLNHSAFSQTFDLIFDPSLPQSTYAAERLKNSLLHHGYALQKEQAEYQISLDTSDHQLGTEAFSIQLEGKKIIIHGGDARGLIYGALSLAEDINNGIRLQQIKPKSERPNLMFRGIKFDLPWDTYRHSYALDLHQETCKDLNYWKEFLDMMVENRFNALTLWNLHPYTYLIRPKNFPEASPFHEKEMKEWQHLFRSIFQMARERGIDTYLVPFNIFVSPEFSKAYHVAMDNLQHDYFVKGDTSEIIKRYTRECVAQVLQEYPDLTGFGLTLGEGMGGMTPQQREDWMEETIIEGMRMAKRKSKLIHRIPFSSTSGSLGPTSIETEKLTRKRIEEQGALDFIEGPVWADLKYNWSHAHSTPKLVKVHGGKLYDTYFTPEPKEYKIIWTARNEDFFCLRWSVPDFIRKHIATNNQSYVGGYLIGSETYIPAKDYFTRINTGVDWKYAFQRQWLFYKLWGRLLYNPSTPDEVFSAEFIKRYGKQAASLLEANALAGTTPLRLASSFDFTWDFTLYSEGFMALDNTTRRAEYISIDRLINQPPTDPDFISIKDYVAIITTGGTFDSNKITPLILASMLEKDCHKALELVKKINTSRNASLMYEVADVKAWSNLGLHFAEKLRGGVALQIYRVKGGEENKNNAVKHLKNALSFWDKVIDITRPLYNDMPLVHFSESDNKNWKENDHLRFHWEKLRPDVARDIETARNTKEYVAK
ncbi:hypothetical protein OCK74_13660 [Chitinophagaceae bacterium LB-8]|uniref:Beta-hexosaminidase bacterial type N-terminal domain-containing protein n=1 Tax=Paraflavisolibacter caeni TaxID=2982496 RepID=A0A9X2XWF8_9BACT|nr:glycoside hydrolase family 20 zincin-like fold domain-containing protein [Paraflavisolibacter caeni]MCU7550165.1 hypothetical protein [Paraflavisolibacter caeni]